MCLGVNSQGNSIPLKLLKNWQVKGYARDALRIEDYYQARYYLNEWHQRDTLNEKVLYNLALSTYMIGDNDKAGHYFGELISKKARMLKPSYYYFGIIQKQNGRYEIAKDAFQKVRRDIRHLPVNVSKEQIDREIAGCLLGIRCRDTIVKSEVVRLNQSINRSGRELALNILSDSAFIYCALESGSDVSVPVDTTYQYKWDCFMAKKESNNWNSYRDDVYLTESRYVIHSGDGVMSLDGQRYYFSRCEQQLNGKNNCQLYVMEKQEIGWSLPSKLGKMVNHPRASSLHPTIGTCFDPNLEVIYFVSDRKGGAGGKDIWFTLYNTKTKVYKNAENAGVYINTNQDEVTPFYDLPSHSLLFSSNGWVGIGGFDVFKVKGELVSWESVENMKVPINSSRDDLNFISNESGRFGLLSSNRKEINAIEETCCTDIFTYHQTESPRVLVRGQIMKEKMGAEGDFFGQLTGKSAVKLPTQAIKNQTLTIQLVNDSNSIVTLQQTVTNDQGEFEVWVDPNSNYQIKVNDNTLLEQAIPFSTKTIESNQMIEIAPVSLTVVPDQPIELKDIYYDYDQDVLTSSARQVLDSTLFLLLNKYPDLRIEIGSHTDNKGDENYNQRLSQRRAMNVVKYLINKGIDANRLVAKGYGESQPKAFNENEDGSDNVEGRQKNRRTEFRIIKKNEEIVPVDIKH
jgi:outer membrane protein OmpA-like peptidoglycan-associated protein/tetratricopeptide (TPR) repeat protein